ncbi:peptidase [Tistrella bauzanensis]|uniref:Peptidase n=1 Tax=Tistrella bauzanensis TaxID=657419 RepID=A0ABQ1IDG2_9PROT|nr:PepSY-associated TM helix domain-containing protein [Tistrella bauzanensis]GGB34234.1 peptidase [Tistrella bauzanensis]
MRGLWVRVHRWAGLSTALFLVLAGLTGSAITFQHELDAWLNPALFQVPGRGPVLTPDDIVTRVTAIDPDIAVTALPLVPRAGEAVLVTVLPRPGTLSPGYDQVFVDPVTGDILGRRDQMTAIMPFLYTFHYSLTAGPVGKWLLGVVALIWALDAVVALWLTLPRGRRPFTRGFGAGWAPAWKIKPGLSLRGTGSHRRVLDLHRAPGLWLWAVFLVLAISSVSLNLEAQVMRPLLSLVADLSPSAREVGAPRYRANPPPPGLSFEQAAARGEAHAAASGLPAQAVDAYHYAAFGVYIISLDEPEPHGPWAIDTGHPHLYLDDSTGAVLLASIPGQGTVGDVFLQLQFPLHSGRIGGLAGRILIAVAGVALALVSITGVVIWWHKRRARRQIATRSAGAPPAAAPGRATP